ncbi:YbjN domain-containing protein [Aliiroseovarius subalbicans]|uniref:YbjN domain-containing protein n=1 Tax=Aliiroseovarius subalbicans TaxID=2925840 RepID=UPI001F5AEDE9|nr:YbjN domain-containing protein [Aliiroseovarius subalbicans]MCI2399758.1 YbjN domain-containing protein [Aliiroseovarius subalbicans]
MFFKRMIIGTALVGTLATSAMADNVAASDPNTLMSYFFNEGIPARLGSDDVGDPMITLRHDGEEFDVFFYGCSDNTDCQSIQFAITYSTSAPTPLEAINTWNAENFFVRAYLTDEGNSRLEFDVLTGRMGLDNADFDDVFKTWARYLEQFADYLD